jgi:hypothetical protein
LARDEVAEVAHHQLIVGVDSFAELENEGVFDLTLAYFLFVLLGQTEIAHEVGEVVGVEVADLGIQQHPEVVLQLFPVLLEDPADQFIEAGVELRELFDHDLVDDAGGLSLHDLVDAVVEGNGGNLQFLEERVEEGQEGVDGGEARDGGAWEVYHCFLDVLVLQVDGGWLLVLVLVQIGEVFADLWADRVCRVVCVFDAVDGVLEDAHECGDAFPGIVDEFAIGVGDAWSHFVEFLLDSLPLLLDFLEDLRNGGLDLLVENGGELLR